MSDHGPDDDPTRVDLPPVDATRAMAVTAGAPPPTSPPPTDEAPDPTTLGAFTYEGGATEYRMNYSETEGWTVFEVFQIAD